MIKNSYSLKTRILLITPPPLDEEAWKKHKEDKDETADITAK
jgi:hypothetical protein